MSRAGHLSTGHRSKAGDFEEFVHATGSRMLRTALLLCGDHQQAEDLTQTTYAKVFSRWRPLHPQGPRRADQTEAITVRPKVVESAGWVVEK